MRKGVTGARKMKNSSKKGLSQVLKEVDPNLNIVSSHKRKCRITKAGLDKAIWLTYPTCGKELLKTYGPLKQRREFLSKLNEVMLEEMACPKCSERAAKATTF